MSKATSPLRFDNDSDHSQENNHIDQIENGTDRLSKVDFSYLSSRMSPMPGAWTVPENTLIKDHNGHEFGQFIDSDNTAKSRGNSFPDSVSYSENADHQEVQGILQNEKDHSFSNSSSTDFSDDDFESVDEFHSSQSLDAPFTNTTSPTKGLNIGFDNNNNLNTNTNYNKDDNSLNYSNITDNTTSFMNSSVPTQDLHTILDENDYTQNNTMDKRQIDPDATPIVAQNKFSNSSDSTPVVASTRDHAEEDDYDDEDDTSHIDMINNDDLKLSSSAINNIFANDENASNNFSSNKSSKFQSVSSSVYSELPNKNPNRFESTTSIINSQVPGHKSVGINEGLKSFRISSFKPTLHKHLSKPLDSVSDEDEHEGKIQEKHEEDPKIPPRSDRSVKNQIYINKYQSVSENEILNFSSDSNTDSSNSENNQQDQPRTRVSVLNQSIFQNHYDSKTGAPSKPSMSLSSIQARKNIPSFLSAAASSRQSGLSFTSSLDGTPSVLDSDGFVDDDDASALFVTSLYAFNSNTLESENDSSICLSFDQDEIAFTYNLDDSGWGEVTLLSSLKRGWVPMNYFRSTVVTDFSKAEIHDMGCKELTETRLPLKLLLKHAGTFLLNPQSKPVYIGGELRGYTFDVECFNGITDGLRKLLIDTNCISRSNSVVQDKPIVRKMRKKLLRGWADLIAKAKDYMGTIATPKIEYLQLLTFHVLQKAITFLDIWGLEQDKIETAEDAIHERETSLSLVDNDTKVAWNSFESVDLHIEYLNTPPIASYRVNEVYNQLLTYLCLIAGRIDLVEHNPKSFGIVGIVIGHINLLVNEYIFIIKLLKNTINESDSEEQLIRSFSKYGKLGSLITMKNQLNLLDSQTEKLTQLVEELNSYLKLIHDASFRKNYKKNGNLGTHPSISKNDNNKGDALYFYSREGGAVVVSACKMIEVSSNAYKILKSIVNFTDEMLLPNNRRYPNYLSMNITPEQFIKQCTAALANDSNIQKQVNNYKKLSMSVDNNLASSAAAKRASNRYSFFKTGNSTDVQLSSNGLDFLSHVQADTASSSPFLQQDGFDPNDNMYDYEFNIEDEIIRSSKDNKIIGASFRALVYLLTDENNPPDYFLISTFFLTFRIFADSAQLLDVLIRRFDIKDNYKNKSTNFNSTFIDSKIRSRRKLVARAFQFWLESYWNSKADYFLLAPLMNFFNEGMKNFLPLESYQLLVIASKLIGNPPTESMNDRLNYYNNVSTQQQLLPRKISSKLHKKTVSRMSLGAGAQGIMGEIEAYNSFLDDIETYELEKVETEVNEESSRNSLSLSLNLELKNSNSNSILLTKQQLATIKKVVISYRRMLGFHWNSHYKEAHFELMDTKSLVESWWKTSQESWKILNDDLTLLNFNGLEIAKQLTLIESKMFCSIQVGELLNQNFTTKKLHLNLSPNIQKSILFTNLLSDYVIESILKPGLQMRQRIHAFKCWLKIAISCLYLRNFNSLASIMTSLQSFLITRVTKLWEGLSDKYEELYHYLASIIHPNKNYHTYREKLRDFLDTNQQEHIDIPTVPYLSLFLQDLTFVVDGNPNYRSNTKSFLDEKLINIDKYFKITSIISDIQVLQVSYKDVGELGNVYNDKNTDLVRSETIKNLKTQFESNGDVSFADMFDITGVPILQELILLEIWKVKQTNARDDDRSWKLSCAIQPREKEN